MCLQQSAGGRPTLRNMRVLVVEDEALVAMLVEDELLGAGAKVVGPALSLDHALRLVEAAAGDGGLSAAVLDINIGGRDISPVAEKLAALGVPFLFATGYSEGHNRDTGGHRAAPTLEKPYDLQRLIAAVGALTFVPA